MGVWYATREDVKGSLDYKETARSNAQVDRAIESASRDVEKFLHRRFYPQIATRYKDWPNRQNARPWRLWLDADELISVATLVNGGTTIPSGDYFLEPVNAGPPYTYIELDLDSNSAFKSGTGTHQRAVAITGTFGYSADTESAGTLTEALDLTETGVDVTDSYAIGVGTVIKVESEYMLVTEKQMLDTTQNLQTDLAASAAGTTVAVTNGSAFTVGETILLDSERMLIVDIAGNNLTVKRAFDGSVLATHSASDIYAPRTLVVQRGALGSTAATHSSSTAIARHVVPGLVRELCMAEAMVRMQRGQSGYLRLVSHKDTSKFLVNEGLNDLRDQVYTAYGRKARLRAV